MNNTVDKHIVTLLQEHDCVIIPEFGGLIAQYTPVRIHPVRHSMAPPAKRIAFNEKLQLNDGRLVAHISLQEKLSETDAATRVQLFVETVNLALNQQQRYQLQDIGLFRKEPGMPIAFEYEEKINLLADSFGLPEVFSKPVQRHRSLSEIRAAVQEKVALPQPVLSHGETARTIPLWRKTLRYAALIPILALSASAIYLASLNNGLELSNLNPVSFVLNSGNSAFPDFFNSRAEAPKVRELTEADASRLYAALAFEAPAAEPAPAYLTDAFLPQQTEEEMAMPTEETSLAEAPASEENWEITAGAPAEPVAELVAKTTPEKRATPVSDSFAAPEIIKARTGRFFVIAGGFVESANARQLQKRALKNGLEAKIIEPSEGSRLHRVSLADFDSREQALQQITTLTSTYGKALWVLEY